MEFSALVMENMRDTNVAVTNVIITYYASLIGEPIKERITKIN